jgi:recombination protein RecT
MSSPFVASPQDAFKSLTALFQRAKPQIALAVPKFLTPDRLIRIALTTWQRTPDLQQCSPMSILGALMQAAQLGLECDNVLGHAYLVPFKNKHTGQMEAQFIIGYKGLLDLASRSDRLAGLPEAQCVFEGDHFEFEYGVNAFLRHKPCGEDNPAKITHAWSLARYRDGTPTFTVMQRSKLERIRASAKSRSGPWSTHFEEMCRKTVLRRHCKTLPLAVELQRHLATEEYVEAGVMAPSEVMGEFVSLPGEQPDNPSASKSDQIASRIASRQKQEELPEEAKQAERQAGEE